MGLNVLLFLILQVAVEPWRRQRLVKGFEEKVMQAIEKENLTSHAREANDNARESQALTVNFSHDISESTQPAVNLESGAAAAQNLDTENIEVGVDSVEPELAATLSHSTPPSVRFTLSPWSWKRAFRDLFSEHTVVMTRKDLTAMAMMSATTGAAAGAAITGILVVVFWSR
jgi:sensitive to high expression protein 9, mitochondrial